jgi:hypothetical protein
MAGRMKVHMWLCCGKMKERGYFEDLMLHGRIKINIVLK